MLITKNHYTMQVCTIKNHGANEKNGITMQYSKLLNGQQGEKNQNLIKMVAHFLYMYVLT